MGLTRYVVILGAYHCELDDPLLLSKEARYDIICDLHSERSNKSKLEQSPNGTATAVENPLRPGTELPVVVGILYFCCR